MHTQACRSHNDAAPPRWVRSGTIGCRGDARRAAGSLGGGGRGVPDHCDRVGPAMAAAKRLSPRRVVPAANRGGRMPSTRPFAKGGRSRSGVDQPFHCGGREGLCVPHRVTPWRRWPRQEAVTWPWCQWSPPPRNGARSAFLRRPYRSTSRTAT